MAFRLYIVPAIGDGTLPPQPWDDTIGPRRPKYIYALPRQIAGLMEVGWYDYGWQPIFIVGGDLTVAEDASVVANADVFAFPFDLSVVPTAGARATAIAAYEAVLLPGQNFVVAGVTWVEHGRIIVGCCRFMQAVDQEVALRTGGHLVVIDTSAKLNVQFGSLPAESQTDILTAASKQRLNSSFITATTQVRAILKGFADQWLNERPPFGPFRL
jgi:hypothetical protein